MPPPTPTRLGSPRFLSFLVAQFLGAVNDNAFKITLTLLVLRSVAGESLQTDYVLLATLLFPLPFLLFSPFAGYLADRYSKNRMLLLTKLPEVGVMALGAVALGSASVPLMMTVLFLMAAQSAFFSPVKYGLLPESVAHEDLSNANGLLEMTTNLAILTGSTAGALLFAAFDGRLFLAGLVYVALAIVGSLAATHVPRSPAGNRGARPAWNLWSETARNWKEVRRLPVLFHTVLGIAYFAFLGSVFLTVVPIYGVNTLGLPEFGAGLLLTVLALGIAAGSLVAGKLSHGRVEIGLVPLGSLMLTLFSIDLGLYGAAGWRIPIDLGDRFSLELPLRAAIDLFALGAAAGVYIVPLNALLQRRSPSGMKGRLVAFSNVLAFSAVILAAATVFLLTEVLDLRGESLILGMAGLTLGATLYILNLLPDFLVRLVLWLLTNAVYRIEVAGGENVPERGALFVANHVSWVDGLLVGTACDRIPRFLMHRPYYEAPALRWFFRRMHVIPIARGDTDEQKEASFAMARNAIEQGHIVCIFAEGAITRTGNLLRFRSGFERIAEGMAAPIIPVLLDGVWGSLFSWERNKLLFKLPRRIPYPVRVVFGEPLPPTARAFDVRRKMQELSVEAFRLRKKGQQPIEFGFLKTARRFWGREFLADTGGRRLRFGEAWTRAYALGAPLFGGGARGNGRVGLLLPPGVPGALANLATLVAGKTVVNLDASRGPERLREEIEFARPECIVTTGELAGMLSSFDPHALPPVVLIEDAERSLPAGRLRRLGLAWRWLPERMLRRRLPGERQDVDRPAAVVLCAPGGPEDRSYGVVLSHHNILSNLESLKQVFRISRDERILGALPFGSSFGLVGTLLLPAVAGLRVVYAERQVGQEFLRAARDHAVSILPISIPQLRGLLELPQGALPHIEHVVVAGDIDDGLRDDFAGRHGREPLEAFGIPECTSLISINVPSTVHDTRGQPRQRPGTQGHPLPGVAVKIVDPVTGDAVPPDHDGVLWVKGPNVMEGYLDDPALTARFLHDGWYRTGYTARQDADGFLTVVGDPGGG